MSIVIAKSRTEVESYCLCYSFLYLMTFPQRGGVTFINRRMTFDNEMINLARLVWSFGICEWGLVSQAWRFRSGQETKLLQSIL